MCPNQFVGYCQEPAGLDQVRNGVKDTQLRNTACANTVQNKSVKISCYNKKSCIQNIVVPDV